MAHPLSAAIEELESQLRDQQQEIVATKKLINSLLKRMGEQPKYLEVAEGGGAMRADEYYGKSVTQAAQMFLERRHQAMSPDEITHGLEQGGFDFSTLNWTEAARVRNIAISLSKNPQTFHKLPNLTWGLTEWYPKSVTAKKEENE
jgi:hypothetical protein